MSDPREAVEEAKLLKLAQQGDRAEARRIEQQKTLARQEEADKAREAPIQVPESLPVEDIQDTPPAVPDLPPKTTTFRAPSRMLESLPTVSEIGEIYESKFSEVTDLISTGITQLNTVAAEAKAAGNPLKAVAAFTVSTIGSGVKGAFNGVTFPVRPAQWKNTVEFVNNLLTPSVGESQRDYETRINAMVTGDIRDPAERDRFVRDILTAMPTPVTSITDEQRESAVLYRAAVVEVIMDDPVAFVAEVAGGFVGGYVAGKIIAKLPDAIRNLTPKTLEQRAFSRLRPLDTIDDAAGILSALDESPATLLPKGKWSKLNHWVPQSRRGSTSIILLVDPITQVIKGILSLEEAAALTGGLPELLSVMGGLQAIPMIRIDEDITAQDLAELNKIHKDGEDLVPKSVLKDLDEDESILTSLLGEGVVVIPDITPDVINDEDIIELSKGIIDEVQEQIQEQAQAQVELLEPILEQIPKETRRIKRSKKDRETRVKLNLRLFRGRKQRYRVTFHFNRTPQEIITPVEARSFPEAVNKAQRKRRPRKKQPILVDVLKLRVKKR